MDRNELKEIIQRVIKKAAEANNEAPAPACIFTDTSYPGGGGPTTLYAIGEEG